MADLPHAGLASLPIVGHDAAESDTEIEITAELPGLEEKDVEDFYKTRIVPRAESRGQTPPTLDAARGFIQEALVQRAINVQSERWLKESRTRLRVEILLDEKSK